MKIRTRSKSLVIILLIMCCFQLHAKNNVYVNNPMWRNSLSSSNNQMYFFGYNVGFPLVKNQVLINPCEIYFGMVSKVGFYVKVKSNFNFSSGYKNPLEFSSDFREITDMKWQRYGGILGIYFRAVDPVYMYFGIGYGSRKQLIDISCYNSSTGLYAEKYYFNRYNSIELEAGLTVKVAIFTVSAGAAMLPIGNKSPYFEMNVGLGMALEASN